MDDWSYDEVGVWPADLTDEMEDWDIAPLRCPRRPYWMDLEGPPAPLPPITPPQDDIARMWDESMKAEKEARKKDAEYRQRRQQINAEKCNNRKMLKAAKQQIRNRLGIDGEYEVYVRAGNQYIRWSYRVENGKAFIHKKRSGWVPVEDRR